MNPTTAPTLAHWLTNARTSWHIPAFVGAFLALISYWALRGAFTKGDFGVAVVTAGLFALGFTLWLIASGSHAQQPKRRTLIQNLQVTTEALAERRVHVFKATSPLNDLKLLHRMMDQGRETGVAQNVRKLTSDKASSGPLEKSTRHLYTPDFARTFPTRILVAEDNPVNQKLVGFMLEKLGYNLTLAQDGQEAIDLATQQGFDLIFMDLCMPNVGGMEAAKHILATGQTPTIVPLTAHASDTSRQACAEAGMTGFIAKPFAIGQLCQAIEAAYKAR